MEAATGHFLFLPCQGQVFSWGCSRKSSLDSATGAFHVTILDLPISGLIKSEVADDFGKELQAALSKIT